MSPSLLTGMLFEPRRTAPGLRGRQPLMTLLVLVVAAALAEALGTLLVVRATTGAGSGVAFLVWNCMLGVAALVLDILVAAVFLPFAARLLGGRGVGEDLAWAVGFSATPLLLSAPAALALQLTPVAAGLYTLVQLALTAWVVWIQVHAMAELFQLPTMRALFALLLGYGLAAVLYVVYTGLGALSLFNTLFLWMP